MATMTLPRFVAIELVIWGKAWWPKPVERDLDEVAIDGRFWRLAALAFAVEGIIALWILGAFRLLGPA